MNLTTEITPKGPVMMEKEMERLNALSGYNLEYDELQESLNDLTLLATKITGTNISAINLLDAYNQWTVAQQGMEQNHMDRNQSVCQYTISQELDFEVKDLSIDARFSTQDYVTKAGLTYYYGVPLKTPEGQALGALCIMDTKMRNLSAEQKEMLQMISRQIINKLDTIKQIQTLKDKNKLLLNTKKIVAHDIRNPILGIIGLAELAADPQQCSSMQEALHYMQLIKKSSQSVLDLAAEILSDNEEEKNKPAVVVGDLTTLQQLKEKIQNLFAARIKDKALEMEVKVSAETADVPFPKSKLQQIIGNLISNAIKFTPSGGKITLGLELLPALQYNRLNITVSDTGTGMQTEMVDQILSGCSQSNLGTNGETGYGLGLTLVKQLILDCRGELALTSEMDAGTTFKVSIPLPKNV